MSVVDDIVQSYRAPRKIMPSHLNGGLDERRSLLLALLVGVVNLVSLTPGIFRKAAELGADPAGLFAGQFVSSIFFLPLALFLLAAILRQIARLLGGKANWGQTRHALIWSALAVSPFALVVGLIDGLIGQGGLLYAVSLAAFLAFVWQFAIHFRVVEFELHKDGSEQHGA